MGNMKVKYFESYGVPSEKWPIEESWLCHWVKTIFYLPDETEGFDHICSDDSCNNCPLSIGGCRFREGSLFYRYLESTATEDRIKLAKEIAEAKVKDDDLSYSPWSIVGFRKEKGYATSIRDLTKLSQEQIIELHRRLWMWKAKKILESKRSISNMDYFDHYDAFFIEPPSSCWLCWYRDYKGGGFICKEWCLKRWGTSDYCFNKMDQLEQVYRNF